MNKYERKPDRVVDMHGLTTKEAGGVLASLFGGQSGRVRLITGKGDLRSGPVLRTFVEGWLRARGVRFERAKVSEGGDGALEVFFT